MLVDVDVAMVAGDPHPESTRDPVSTAGRMSTGRFIITNRFFASPDPV